MDANNPTFQEFRAYWQLSEEMIADATKDDLVETARILALQVAHLARKYEVAQLPDVQQLLSSTHVDEESIGLLRDGAETFVGILGLVSGVGGTDLDETVQ